MWRVVEKPHAPWKSPILVEGEVARAKATLAESAKARGLDIIYGPTLLWDDAWCTLRADAFFSDGKRYYAPTVFLH